MSAWLIAASASCAFVMASWNPIHSRSEESILGIDPGLNLTGDGCVDLPRGRVEPTLVEAGVLRLKTRSTIAFRLVQLHDDLLGLIDELKPDRIVIEKLFSHYKHVRTAILMAHGRGVVMLAGQM